MNNRASAWPELPYAEWANSCATLQLWTQIVGKIRLAKSPWLNHGWHVTLYVSPRGLTTSPIADQSQTFQIDFDFIGHRLRIQSSSGKDTGFALEAMTVADFYDKTVAALNELDIDVAINMLPNEVPDPIRFDEDNVHSARTTPEYANRFWRALVQIDRVFKEFRSRLHRQMQPRAFLLGQLRPGGDPVLGTGRARTPRRRAGLPDPITREAYSREVSSAGWWPGGGPIDYAAFYSYAYPAPEGFAESGVQPAEAFFDNSLGEFLLPYDAVRTAADPDATLLSFLQTTYEAAADKAGWDRANLEREPVRPAAISSHAR